jgi:Secretion system C-terminal sorting domain/IPT/TIG domain
MRLDVILSHDSSRFGQLMLGNIINTVKSVVKFYYFLTIFVWMKRLVLIFSLLLTSFFSNGQLVKNASVNSNNYFDYCVDNSDLIIEGEVISQNSYWNPSNMMIFTDNVLKIYKVFKGNVSAQTIVFTSKGGTVGNNKIEIDGLLNARINEKGIYYLIDGNSGYEPLSAKKEIDSYNNNIVYTNQGTFTISDYRQKIVNKVGTPFTVVNSYPLASQNYSNNKAGAQIDSLYPISITAGTGDILTIEGQGFGFVRGNGNVLFTSTSFGEPIVVQPYPAQYISWNDTLIQVEVPSRTFSGAGISAGTGPIMVLSDSVIGNTVTSTIPLQIPYSRYNLSNGGLQEPKFKDDNNFGGYTFVLDSNLHNNTNANEAFQRGLESWRCATNVNWVIGTPINSSVPLLDGNSAIRFSDLDPWNISRTTKYYIQCGTDWYIEEVDIEMNDSLNWNYGNNTLQANEYDFQSEMTLALGIAHLVQRSNDSNSVMHHTDNLGTIYRNLAVGDIDCGNYVMGQSLSALGCALGPMTPIGNCFVGFANDAALVEVIMPGSNGGCSGMVPVAVMIRNPGLNILTTVQIDWSVGGVPQTSYNWSGNLGHGDSTIIQLGTYNLPGGFTAVSFSTSMPNGLIDQQPGNDTINDIIQLFSCSAVDFRPVGFRGPVCLGLQPVTITFINIFVPGGPPVVNCTVQWEIDGIRQQPFYFLDTIVTSSAITQTIGTYNFTVSGVQLKVWVEYPNGLPNLAPVSLDTLYYTIVNSGLSGVYTVGGVSPDYADLDLAFSDIENSGLCGPVILNMRPGTYSGLYEIATTSVTLTTSTNTLTIQSENGDSSSVILLQPLGSSNSQVLKVRDMGYVNFNKLTFKTQNDGALLHLSWLTHHINIKNCAFIGDNGINSVGVAAPTGGGLGYSDNVIISNCIFNKLGNGINITGHHATSIENNVFDTINSFVIHAQRCNNMKITKNYKSPSTFATIYMWSSKGGLTISNNEFYNTETHFIRSVFPAGSPGQIYNNIFSGHKSLNSSGGYVVLFSDSIKNIDFIHNTVEVNHPLNTTAALVSVSPSWPGEVSGFRVINNIFANNGSNTSNYAISTGFYAPFLEVKGNCYYSTSSNYASIGSPDITWFYGDTTSININPELYDTTNMHFQLQTVNYQLIGAGVPTNITDDINGNLRATNPTIGADEITLANQDVEATIINIPNLNCDSSAVEFLFRNVGTNTLTSLTVNWMVNGVLQVPFNWSGSLPSFSYSGNLIIGGYNFQSNNVYNIKIWGDNPNGLPDLNNLNDTVEFNIDYSISVSLGMDTVACLGDSIILGLNDSFSSYSWSDSSIDSVLIVGDSALYWCIVTDNNGCTATDTVLAGFKSLPILQLGIDTGFCAGGFLVLDPFNAVGNGIYSWQDSSTDSTFTATQSGIYWVQFELGGCINVDSVLIDTVNFPTVSLGNDSTLCDGTYLTLNMATPNSNYLWNNGSTNDTLIITQAGQYWGRSSNACGIVSDTININFFTPSMVSISAFNPDSLCLISPSVTLPLGSPSGGSYSGIGVVGNDFDPSAAGVGAHNIIYSITDSNSCINDDTTMIYVQNCVGIDEITNEIGISIYPNPSNGLFTIEKSIELDEEVHIVLIDANAKLIVEKTITSDKQKVSIDITSYSSGIYYIQFIIDNEIFIKKILKD